MQKPSRCWGLAWGRPRVKSHTGSWASGGPSFLEKGRIEWALGWQERGSWVSFLSSHRGEAQSRGQRPGRAQQCWGMRVSNEWAETAQ